jgi:hypothetical protein
MWTYTVGMGRERRRWGGVRGGGGVEGEEVVGWRERRWWGGGKGGGEVEGELH